MTKKIEVPIEDAEAITFVGWLEQMKMKGKIIDYCHIPNESYGGTWKDVLRGKKLKRMGRKKGVFDYQIFLRLEKDITRECFFNENGKLNYMDSQEIGGQIICVELKRAKKTLSKVSKEQKEWQQVYIACGIPAAVCYGADEAIRFVERYL